MDNNSGKYFGRKVPEKKTAEENIRPGFLNSTDKLKKQDAAAQGLGVAEKFATQNNNAKDGKNGLLNAKNAESKTGFYTGAGGGGKVALAKKLINLKGSFGKKVAGFAVFGILFIAGVFIATTQSFQPFDLLSQFKDTFNSMHTSVNKRSDRFFKAQMKTGRTKNPIRGSKIFGRDFKISEKQQKKLKAVGIEYDDKTFKKANGDVIKVLKYEDDSGNIKVIGVDEDAVKDLNALNLANYDTGVEGKSFDAEAISFKVLYYTNNKFFQTYNAGSMTWRGEIGNWFGKNTAKYLTNNRLIRNRFQNWQEEKKQAGGEEADTKKMLKEKIAKGTGSINEGGSRVTDLIETEDEDGNKKYEFETTNKGGGTYNLTDWTESSVKAKLNEISGRYTNAASVPCAIINTISAINLLVQTSEMLQILNITTAYFEAIDKTEYGLGDDAPINDIANTLNEKKKIDHTIVNDSGVSELIPGKEKTAIESAGISALYDNKRVDPHDPSVESFNVLASSNKLLGGLGQSPESFKNCYLATAVTAAGSALLDIIACTNPITCAIDLLVSWGTSLALGVILSQLVSIIAPTVVNMLTRDLISDLAGEDLGNALTSGGNSYLGSVHRANGGSLSTIEKYEEFAPAQQEIAAENARYERDNLSQFDTTSSSTFMGSILKQLSRLVNTDSVVDTVVVGESSIQSALVSLLPSTFAASITETLPNSIEEYEDVNPYLASIGAIGDSYGNPYIITDLETIEDDPADVINNVGEENFSEGETSDGNAIVKPDSKLAKYIRYCDNRYSPFGVADQNIVNEILGDGVSSNVALGSSPILGDILDIVQSQKVLKNIGWVTGESCVAGNEVTASESVSWKEGKNFQRFIEDQSLAESMGLIEQSAASAYLEEYYKENPLDNSYEGVLARYSGMTKENVTALLDIVEYYNFIATYNASNRYAFGAPVIEEDDAVEFDNENVLAGEFILPNQIVYADVRNRVFTV